MWTHLTLPLLLAGAWPPGYLSADELARIDRGVTVQQGSYADGKIHFSLTARIEAEPRAVFTAARDICSAMKAQKATARFLDADSVERVLASGEIDVDDPALRSLPAMDCRQAGGAPRVYVLVKQPGPSLLPDMEMMLRQDVVHERDGSLALRTNQVLGGIAGSKVDTELKLVPLPDGKTAYAMRGVFVVPSIIPGFVIDRLMQTPEDENPQLKRLEDLRARVRTAAKAPEVSPPATMRSTPPGR